MSDMQSSHKGTIVSVKDVMSGDYRLVKGVTTVAEALQQIRGTEIRVLVVDKRDERDEYGIVLFSDIAKKVLARNKAPERVNLYEIMAKPALGVAPEMQIRFCARLFERFGLSVAPVIDSQGRIQGVVNYESLVMKGLLGP